MVRKIGVVSGLLALALLMFGNLMTVGAQGPPDLTKFGYPTVAKSMDLTPDQAATITAGDQSVAIKAGTFDSPVTFDLLTSDPGTWKDLVKDRTVRAAFAFRITDKATKALVATLKQPVTYSYAGKDALATDVILNTTAASPPVISVNGTPPTFDGKVTHTFGGAGVGWLVASASTSAAAGTPAAAAGTPAAAAGTTVAQASPSATAAGTAAPSATAASTTAPSAAAATTAPSATAAATTAPTATRPAATTAPVATGTGGGTAATTAPTTLPKTGNAHATSISQLPMIVLGSGLVLLIAGFALVMRRRAGVARN